MIDDATTFNLDLLFGNNTTTATAVTTSLQLETSTYRCSKFVHFIMFIQYPQLYTNYYTHLTHLSIKITDITHISYILQLPQVLSCIIQTVHVLILNSLPIATSKVKLFVQKLKRVHPKVCIELSTTYSNSGEFSSIDTLNINNFNTEIPCQITKLKITCDNNQLVTCNDINTHLYNTNCNQLELNGCIIRLDESLDFLNSLILNNCHVQVSKQYNELKIPNLHLFNTSVDKNSWFVDCQNLTINLNLFDSWKSPVFKHLIDDIADKHSKKSKNQSLILQFYHVIDITNSQAKVLQKYLKPFYKTITIHVINSSYHDNIPEFAILTLEPSILYLKSKNQLTPALSTLYTLHIIHESSLEYHIKLLK